MLDTLPIKDLAIATIGATQLPGAANNFPRVLTQDPSEAVRQSLHKGALNPLVISIRHKTSSAGVRTATVTFAQTLARVDAQSNVLSTSLFKYKQEFIVPSDVTEAEFMSLFCTAQGACLESSGAFVKSLYNREG